MKRKHISNFQYDRHEIERALFFLSNALQKSGHNAKPVFLHSIQVAEMLWERDFPQDIVIAAILHDVIEDTDVTIQEIECKFGQQVMRYVDVLTISSKMSSSLLFAQLNLAVMYCRFAQQTLFRIATIIIWRQSICKDNFEISMRILWNYPMDCWTSLCQAN